MEYETVEPIGKPIVISNIDRKDINANDLERLLEEIDANLEKNWVELLSTGEVNVLTYFEFIRGQKPIHFKNHFLEAPEKEDFDQYRQELRNIKEKINEGVCYNIILKIMGYRDKITGTIDLNL